MTNYCPFRVRYYNDGKNSITYELLEVADQNSWAAEKDFIGTDRVKEEEILPYEGIERRAFPDARSSWLSQEQHNRKMFSAVDLLFSSILLEPFPFFQEERCVSVESGGASLHKVISTSATWRKGLNQKIWLYSLQIQQPRF